MCNTIILDFDGVILESVSVKTDAFRDLFSVYPEHIEEIVMFHKKNGGMSRFDKFRYIYKNILKIPLSEEEIQILSQKFTQLVLTKVLCVSYVPGAEDFLHQCSGRMRLFIVSATPQEELEYIIEKRGLKQFFNNVFGSPKRKEEHIKNILSEYSVSAGSTVFIGDSLNDWKAAKETGIRFIARITPESSDDFLGRPCIEHTIMDLHELIEYFGRAGCL
jgi:HAD superfamily hydrolase (TIGR01549 family)